MARRIPEWLDWTLRWTALIAGLAVFGALLYAGLLLAIFMGLTLTTLIEQASQGAR